MIPCRSVGRRLQAMVTCGELQDVGLDLEAFTQACGVWVEGDSIEEPSFLLSLEGCLPQMFHFDYDDFPIDCPPQQIPRSCILALEAFDILMKDGVYNGRNDGIDPKTVHVPQGALLVFRGDLRHAGGGSLVECMRLHWFLDKPALPWGRHPSGYTIL